MNKTRYIVASVLLLGALSMGSAHATIIDFTSMSEGTVVSSIGDVSFSLAGVGASGTPMVNNYGTSGLGNSPTTGYPTNTILRLDFASAVSIDNFYFTPYGTHGTSQGWSIYDTSDMLIASGNFTGGWNTYDLSSYSNVSRLDFNNGGNDWIMALGSIEYNAVPEPATITLLGAGLIGFGVARRKVKK